MNPKDVIKKGAELLKSAKAKIAELSGQVDEKTTKLAHAETRVKEAAAYGPEIVDKMIKLGMISPDMREHCLESMKDPVKVASQLAMTLERGAPVTVGAPESGEDAGMKFAAEDAQQSCDDRYREMFAA